MNTDKRQEKTGIETGHISRVLRKSVFGVSDQVRHKQICTITEEGRGLKFRILVVEKLFYRCSEKMCRLAALFPRSFFTNAESRFGVLIAPVPGHCLVVSSPEPKAHKVSL